MNIKALKEITKGVILRDEPLSRHLSFKTGGNADLFIEPLDAAELSRLIRYFRDIDMPCYILGNGTNVLASDKGFRGAVIHIGKEFSRIENSGDLLTLGAGSLMSEVGKKALGLSLTGFEALSGIPGSVGGAVIMNAGAYESEFKDVLVSVSTLDGSGAVRELLAAEAGLRYRGSRVMDEGLIVLSAVIRLRPGDRDLIRARMEELMRRREEKQPLSCPSAGSTFKRPEGNFAGRLIADAGLKGVRVGGAAVSEKHAGFIVNAGGASSDDIYRLIHLVQDKVREESGVLLVPEVRFLGDF